MQQTSADVKRNQVQLNECLPYGGFRTDKMKQTSGLSLGNIASFELIDDDAADMTPRGDDEATWDKSYDATFSMDNPLISKAVSNYGAKLNFTSEKNRISQRNDTFIPHPKLTISDVENERSRLQLIEDSSRAYIRQASSSPSTKSTVFSIDDFYATRIQSSFRGYIGRKKAILCHKIIEMSNDTKNDNDWVEVRDRASGDVWYYNKSLGVSQWERPQEMKSTLTANESLKLIPVTERNPKSKSAPGQASANIPKSKSEKHLKRGVKSEQSLNRMSSLSKLLKPIKLKSIQRPGFYSEYDIQAQRELENLMGIDKMLSSEKLISPDGHFKPQLRTTVLDALLESKFDSVATVIADGAWAEKAAYADTDEQDSSRQMSAESNLRPVNRLNKPMVSVMKLHDKKSKKTGYELNVEGSSNDKITKLSDLTVRDISHPGFIANTSDITINQFVTRSTVGAGDDSSIANQNLPTVCFACWSSGSRSCEFHSNADAKSKPSESMLLCRNWDLGVMQRRYRAEEIQEIFMKRSQSLRYDMKRKKFSTVEEYRHIIYRLLFNYIHSRNHSKHLFNRVKRWMWSLKDVVSSQTGIITGVDGIVVVPARVEEMRARRTKANSNLIKISCQDIRAMIPKPPTTGYSWAERQGKEKYLYKVIDPSTGKEVELIVIKPLPVSVKLYAPREYHLPIPRTIPLPLPSYDDNARLVTLPTNKFIDDLLPHSWVERLASSITRDAIQSSISHVQALTPASPLEYLRHAKQSAPATVKFALIGRKPTQDMQAVGGLPVELLAYQLVTTYYPPQYGSFVVMDKSVISPGITPETMIVFESWPMPPGKQVYVMRPVEHPLNYRKSPTIGVYSVSTDMVIDNKFYYGLNRPEQTGEQDSHGFRTSTFIKHLDIYQETDPLAFSPGSDIVSFNAPGANKSFTTHADLTYPFCEPSTRDNSTLDFYHLLLSNIFSFAKPQVFTSLSVQEAGSFLKESKDNLPLGFLVVSVYRSWAFVQKDVIEEFRTDDGVPYWYHRRTGQTFWQRPLYDEENVSPMLGGTILDSNHNEEPTVSRFTSDGITRRYLQGDFRKSILTHHETDREAIRRRWNVAYAAEKARDRGLVPLPNTITEESGQSIVAKLDAGDDDIARLVQQRQDNAVMNAVIAGGGLTTNIHHSFTNHNATIMEKTAGMMELEINAQKNKTASIPDNTSIFDQGSSTDSLSANPVFFQSSHMDDVGSSSQSQKRDLTIQTAGLRPNSHHEYHSVPSIPNTTTNNRDHQQPQAPGAPFAPGVLSSITDSISQLLSNIDTANPQDMIQLGLGMGMAIMSSAAVQSMTDSVMNPHQAPPSTNSRAGFDSFGSPRTLGSATTVTAASGQPTGHSPLRNTGNTGFRGPDAFSPKLTQISEEGSPSKQANHMHSHRHRSHESEPIGLPNPTVSTSVNKNLDHYEESQQKREMMKQMAKPLTTMEKARKLKIAQTDLNVSAIPDIASGNSEYLDYPRNADERMREKVPILMYPELSTVGNFPPDMLTHPSAVAPVKPDHDVLVDANSRMKVQRHVLPLPNGFHQAIFSSHVAKQEADYLPQVPNLPQTRTVGRVKPRSAALDWIVISFDPWSAGKQPVSSEFVSSLTANANKFFEGGDGRAVDAIEMLRHETIADAFTNAEDVEGQMQQRAEISRAQIMAQDFKKICSLCRHNKFSEVEQLINQPDWTLPIDYQDDQGNTLLHIAAQNGNKRMIKIFLRRGISLDTQNLQGQTALHYLYGYGYADVGEYLVKKGANDSIRNKDGLTCYEGLGARELALL
jgi:hypothetical protein